MKMYRHGFVIGKFMPLHNGHVFLIDTALRECGQVTICLLSRSTDVIEGEVRFGWLTQLYGNACHIVHHQIDLPQDASREAYWELYLHSILTVCPGPFDVVFSSEQYGQRLAGDLQAKHRMVDHERSNVHISGTEIRSNPKQHLELLPPIVKKYFEKR